MRFLLFLKHCLNMFTDERFIADAHAFGETRSTRSVVFWENGDAKGTHEMHVMPKGRRDAEVAEVAEP